MLPLPSPTTQRKLLSSSECAFGFNQLALDAIFEKLKGVKDFERWITLMLDEMTCTKELEFCTRTLKWKGIVDFGGDLHIQVPNGMCDHVLVFSAQVFKGTPDAWIQPFAWSGTKGASPGRVLLEIVIKAIAKLCEKGAIVKAVVCDGCAPNKSMMNLFGVSGELSGSCHVTHAIDPNHKVYFFTDVPHLLKSTRNNIYKHKIVQVYFRDKFFSKLITDISFCISSLGHWSNGKPTKPCIITGKLNK
jgi:hypothetical protein